MFKALISKLFTGGSGENDSGGTAVQSPVAADPTAFVNYVVRGLVDSPDSVSVATEENDNGVVIKITCNKDEIGKIIGRNGRTIAAIRSLVRSAAGRINQNATVVVAE